MKKKSILSALAVGALCLGMATPTFPFAPLTVQARAEAATEPYYSYTCTKCQWSPVETPSNIKKETRCSKGGNHNWQQLEKRVEIRNMNYVNGRNNFSFRPLKGQKWVDGHVWFYIKFDIPAPKAGDKVWYSAPNIIIYDADTGKKISETTGFSQTIPIQYNNVPGLKNTNKIKRFYFQVKPDKRAKYAVKYSGKATIGSNLRYTLVRRE